MAEKNHVTTVLATFARDRALAGALLAPGAVQVILPGATLPDESSPLVADPKSSTGLAISLARHPDASAALLTRLAKRRLVGIDVEILGNPNTPVKVFLEVLARKNRVTTHSTIRALHRCTLAELATTNVLLDYQDYLDVTWAKLLGAATALPPHVAWAFDSQPGLAGPALDAVAAAHDAPFLALVLAGVRDHTLNRLAHHGKLGVAALPAVLSEMGRRAGAPGLSYVNAPSRINGPEHAAVIAASHWAPRLVVAALEGDPASVAKWMTSEVLAILLASDAPGMYGRYTLWVMYPQSPALPQPPAGRQRTRTADGSVIGSFAVDQQVAALQTNPTAGAEQLAELLAPLAAWGLAAYAAGRLGVVPRGDVLLATARRHHDTSSPAMQMVCNVLGAVADQRRLGGSVTAAALLDQCPAVVFYACERLGAWVTISDHSDPSHVDQHFYAWAPAYLAHRLTARFGASEAAWRATATFGPAMAQEADTVTQILDAIETMLAQPAP